MLRDLRLMRLIHEDNIGEFRPYLNAIYVAGLEQGHLDKNQHTNKTIGQFDSKGQLINTFKSQKDAAVKTGFTVKGLYNSMHRGTPTRQGWTWKYL